MKHKFQQNQMKHKQSDRHIPFFNNRVNPEAL